MLKPPLTEAKPPAEAVTVPLKTAAASVDAKITGTVSPLGSVMVLSTAPPVVLTRAARSPVTVKPSTPTNEAVPFASIA
jgi:hypothetical protein